MSDENRPSTRDLAPPPASSESAASGSASGDEPLLSVRDLDEFRSRWEDVEVRFVDDPRDAVSSADALVGEVMQSLTDTFSNERSKLEGQWDRGDEVGTEDLRRALQRYRSFFDRLLRT